jgi:hypothetical protein
MEWVSKLSTRTKGDWSANCTWIRVIKDHWIKETQELRKLEDEIEKDDVCHRLYATYIVSTLSGTLLKYVETSVYWGQVILDVKFADDLVLLTREQAVLQDMIGRITEIGRCYGREMNV